MRSENLLKRCLVFDIECDLEGKPFLIGLYNKQRNFLRQAHRDSQQEWSQCLALIRSDRTLKVIHNAQYEIKTMRRALGIEIGGEIHDTLLLSKVYRNDLYSYALDSLAGYFLGEDSPKYKQMTAWIADEKIRRRNAYKTSQPKGTPASVTMFSIGYHEVPREMMLAYNREDLEHTWNLFEYLVNHKALEREIPYQLMRELIEPIISMSSCGIQIDKDHLRSCQRKLGEILQQIEQKAAQKYPGLLLTSNKQLGQLLVENNYPVKRTPKQNIVTSAEELENFKDFPAVKLRLLHAKYKKLKSTYFDGLLERVGTGNIIYPETRIHGTVTYRFSTVNPNGQNFPKRKDDKRFAVRQAFIPRDGYLFICADYSQIEYRLFGHYTKEPKIINAYKDNPLTDFHQATANFTGLERSVAKNGNFAKIYGAGISTFSRKFGVPLVLAQQFYKRFSEQFPVAEQFTVGLQNACRIYGYTEDCFGHRLYVPRDKAYVGLNYLIQGTAAQVMKIALVELHKYFQNTGCGARILLSIHDEFLIECPRKNVKKVVPAVKSIMENFQFNVPMIADIKIAEKNWKEQVAWTDWLKKQTELKKTRL